MGWHGTCIRIEPSRYRHLGSVHDALRQIQAIPPNPEGGARSNATLFDCNATASRRTVNANSDTEAGALMFGSLYFILIKYQLAVKLAMLELMCVCACARASVCVSRSLQLFPYTSRINFKHLVLLIITV